MKRDALALLRKRLENTERNLKLITNSARCHDIDAIDVLRLEDAGEM
jgi:hypothetical protein